VKAYLTGVVGKDLTIEQGYEAARHAVLNSLSEVTYAPGDLDRVQQIIQLIGFVNSAPASAISRACSTALWICSWSSSASGASRRGSPSAVRACPAIIRWTSC
jgi:hypothetical protein